MIDRSFFLKETAAVAYDIIGIKLSYNGKDFIITEAESYGGQCEHTSEDDASHGHKSNRKRNSCKSMFLEGGHCYIYPIFQYHCLNFITETNKKHASAMLIRSLYDINSNEYINRPGMVCIALGIKKNNYTYKDGVDLFDKKSEFVLSKPANYEEIQNIEIINLERFGLGKTVSSKWKSMKWRYKITPKGIKEYFNQYQ